MILISNNRLRCEKISRSEKIDIILKKIATFHAVEVEKIKLYDEVAPFHLDPIFHNTSMTVDDLQLYHGDILVYYIT